MMLDRRARSRMKRDQEGAFGPSNRPRACRGRLGGRSQGVSTSLSLAPFPTTS